MSMRKKLRTVVVLCLLFALCLCGCRNEQAAAPTETTAPPEMAAYEVKVTTRAGLILEGVQIYLYADDTCQELLDMQSTDNMGIASFTTFASETLVVTLDKVPEGYESDKTVCYPILGALTEIVLAPKSIGDEPIDPFSLSDVMLDFTVTDPNGKEYNFSQLMADKDALILMFWSSGDEDCAEELLLWQEAMGKYESAAFLGLNPLDENETITDYAAKNGIKLPLAQCGKNLSDAFDVTDYPTTVIIDREGKISLIHGSPMEESEIVEGVLDHYTADEYTHKPVTDLQEILPEGEEGSALNPMQISGKSKVEITIEPGEEFHAVVFTRAATLYMACRSSDLTFDYNDKTYEPKNGIVGTYISGPDTYTPAKVVFKNTSKEKKTFTVTFGQKPGSFDNPYELLEGETKVDVPAGANDGKGVHFLYESEKDGYLLVELLSGTTSCSFTLYNLDSYQYLVSDEDLLEDAENPTIRIKAKKGHEVMLIVSTVPSADFTYPAGSFNFKASFTEGLDPEDALEEKKIDYTITVKDDKGQPMEGVQLQLTGSYKDDKEVEHTVNETVRTDAQGVVAVKLLPSDYGVSVRLPEGYKAEVTKFDLTAEVTTLEITLTEVVVVMKTYTVIVEDTMGNPVPGALVAFGGKAGTTDASGKVMYELEEGTYTAFVSAPAGYTCDTPSAAFPEGETTLTITVTAPAGTVGNPIQVSLSSVPGSFETVKIAAGQSVYYDIFAASGTMLTVEDENAVIVYDGKTFTHESGVISLYVESMNPRMPVSVQVCNNGSDQQAFTLKFNALLGSFGNPEALTDITEFKTVLEADDQNGYYYQWTATGTGTVTFKVGAATAGISPDVRLSSNGGNECPWLSDGATDENGEAIVTMEVNQGDKVLIQVVVQADEETFAVPAGEITVCGSFVGETTEPDEEEPDVPDGTYMVTVEDYFGNPMANAVVSLVTNGTMVSMQQVNTEGVVSVALDPGEYTVSLSFTDGVVRHYKETVLTAEKTSATIRVAENLGDETAKLYGNPTHFVYVGGTYVTLQSDVQNYFLFTPEEEGIYKFTTSDPAAKISFWGGNIHYIFDQTANTDYADNAFTREVKTGNLGVVYVLGVTGADEAIIEITRIGGPTYDPVMESAWVNYELSKQPTAFKLPAGTTLTYVDITGDSDYYKLVLNEKDGYYHVGSADGPVLYMELGKDAPYISMYNLLGLSGYGGSRFGYYFFDENGTFLYKESYNDGMVAYTQKRDTASGVYPVTPDLAYMMQMGGSDKGWWDKESINFIFDDVKNSLNLEIAWMFACCFDESQYDYTEPDSKVYAVTVTDYFGEPIPSAVVSYFSGGSMVAMKTVNDSGVATAELPLGSYTVNLSFTDGVTRHYKAVTLTTDVPNATVKVAQDVSDKTQELYDNPTHFVEVGGTYVTLQKDADNYFFFEPTSEGVFKFTTSDPNAVISYWGSNPHFIWNQTESTDYANNTFTHTVRKDNLGASYIIGVTGADSCIIEITLIGGPAFDPAFDAVWEEYTPKKAAQAFKLPSGTKLTQVDLTASTDSYKLVVDEDGIYHLNTADGPVVYIKLGQGAPYVSMYELLGMTGFGGTRFGKMFYDADGNFLRKESYNEAMLAFTGAIDPNAGVYPLTEDLVYMIQQGGEYKGWWDPENPNFLFKDANGNRDMTINLEIAWLFACYVANK